jgi:hypothetical protein
MPTHQSTKGFTRCSGVAKLGRCFSYEGGFETILLTLEDTTKFMSSTFDVGQSNNGRSRVDRC